MRSSCTHFRRAVNRRAYGTGVGWFHCRIELPTMTPDMICLEIRFTFRQIRGNVCSYWIFIKYTSLYWADPVFEMSKLLSKTRYFPSRLIEARGTAQ